MKYTAFPAALLAGLTGSVAALLLTTSSANAQAAPDAVHQAHMDIRQEIVAAGFTTDVNTADCTNGMMGYVDFKQKELVLCVDNHKGNISNLYDTIRHESLHVAQYCMKGLLSPENKDMFLSEAQDLGFSPLAYEPKAWYIESEAWALADRLTGDQVRQIVNVACN